MRRKQRLLLAIRVTAGLAVTVAVTQVVPAGASGGSFGTGTPVLTTSSVPAGTNAYVDTSGEPSVGIDWTTGKGMYMSGFGVERLSFDPASGAATWADVSPIAGFSANIDPILVTEPGSGVTLAGGDTGACSAMWASTDDGASWLPSLPCTVTIDHPTVGYAPSALLPGTTTFYYCQHAVAQHCVTSATNGLTWTPSGTSTSGPGFIPTCVDEHGHLRGGADGTAYLPGKSCFRTDGSAGVGGLVTSNDGATWSQYLIPGATSAVFDPSVAVARDDNTVYEAWQSADSSHPMIARSHDHGSTWSAPVDLAGTVSPALTAASFPTLVTGDAGRIAYSFLGTSVGTGNPNASGFHGVWYLYTSYSYDGGATWTTVRDTANPVQYGEIDAGGTATTGQRNLLDFIDSSLTKDGRVVVAYANGCLADCQAKGTAGDQAGAEALSTHAWASVAYQTAGKGLLSAYDSP